MSKESSIRSNLSLLSRFSNLEPSSFRHSSYIAVVKANGYNQGSLSMVKQLQNSPSLGYFAVGRYEEAIYLRHKGILTPIILMGYTFPDHYEALVSHSITVVISDLVQLKSLVFFLRTCPKKIDIWLKIDTGMRRLGLYLDALSEVVTLLQDNPLIDLKGFLTHFSVADANNSTFSSSQLSSFIDALILWESMAPLPLELSFSNSSAFLNFDHIFSQDVRAKFSSFLSARPQLQLLPRLGLSLHGLRPSPCLSLPHEIQKPQTWTTVLLRSFDGHPLIPLGRFHGLDAKWPFVSIEGTPCSILSVYDTFSLIDLGRRHPPLFSTVHLLSESQGLSLDAISEKSHLSCYELMNRIQHTPYYSHESFEDSISLTPDQSVTKILLSKSSLSSNYTKLSQRYPSQSFALSLQFYGYGHGIFSMLDSLNCYNPRCIIIDTLNEAIQIRQRGFCHHIHVLEPIYLPQDFDSAVSYDLGISIYHIQQLELIYSHADRVKKSLRIYIKISSFPTSIGISVSDASQLNPDLFCSFNFFYDYDKQYKKSLNILRKKLGSRARYHLYNLPHLLPIPDWIDTISSPFMLYGCHHSFSSVLSLITKLTQRKDVRAGDFVSYGNTYRFSKATRLAVLPLGYADGFSNHDFVWPYVLQSSRRYSVVGRICMDQCMIEDSAKSLRPNIPITVIGPGLSIKTLSKQLNQPPLAILAALSKRIPRFMST
ncbi:MAG: alanine racemase [bacterium]